MKIIFLDIEGVIVSHRSIVLNTNIEKKEFYDSRSNGWHRFVDPLSIGLVFKLAEDFGAKIVLTSTLRTDPKIVSALDHMWLKRNEDADHIYGHTGHSGSREDEIMDSINNLAKSGVIVSHKVVIDDRMLDISDFVRTDPHEGFTYANYVECRRHLTDNPATLKPELIFL